MFEELINQLNVLDWIFIVWMSFSMLLGLMRGFVGEILSLLGWVIAFFLASHYGAAAGKIIPLPIKEELPILLIGFLVVFIGFLIGWTIFRMILNFAIGKGFLDYLLGLVFGTLRGIVVTMVALTIIGMMISLPNQLWWQNAYFRDFLRQGVQQFDALMPLEWKDHLKVATERLQSSSTAEMPSTDSAPSSSMETETSPQSE